AGRHGRGARVIGRGALRGEAPGVKPYVRSSSARLLREEDGRFLIFNGINVQLWVSGETVELLRAFDRPAPLEEVLRGSDRSPGVEASLAELRRHLFLVPAEPDHLEDMRATWDCLAQGSDDDVAFVIDNETRTLADFRRSGEEALQALEALVSPQPSWRVVNIGCGMGRIDRYLAPRVAQLTGLDVSDAMLERAHRYLADCPNVDLRRADDALALIEPRSVDLVISFLVFQHCPKEITWRYFREAGRVLKPGAPFVFQVLCYEDLAGYDPAPASPVERYYGRGKPRYGAEEVRRELQAAGLRIETFRDADHAGIERRLAGTSAPHWRSKLVRAAAT
ncbi:MAG: class I SAM-dependent methyltransferase, partial [Gammaproteobacteria bacterium]|nr:class I SAM-dependent methyltransferase [Gammaproteobacteria bacterium]